MFKINSRRQQSLADTVLTIVFLRPELVTISQAGEDGPHLKEINGQTPAQFHTLPNLKPSFMTFKWSTTDSSSSARQIKLKEKKFGIIFQRPILALKILIKNLRSVPTAPPHGPRPHTPLPFNAFTHSNKNRHKTCRGVHLIVARGNHKNHVKRQNRFLCKCFR